MNHVFYDKLADVCHSFLKRDRDICSYLTKRGMTAQTINDYKLGSFPKDLRDLFNYIHPAELKEQNIVYCADRSPFSLYPLVIPIRDTSGKSVAIGCRTLLTEDRRKELGIPKYRNSGYHKTSFLFGLDKAAEEIRRQDKVFVVEGYFDAISAHQYGMRNVVATCGTLFSRRQLIILSRYTDNVCILFDNDAPGRDNSKLVQDKFADNGYVKLTCAFTPDGYKDLDEYLTSGGTLDYFRV